ncbi:glycosyltransferase family 2 protein [Ureibacillus aquaedulcis]|uniref:Glycosyltransferase family 2 protein n=1 Tax=Ureibacillus aquaedulcis TaxID=3058421 RepID=A0ABT8GMP4_9BACL|nr:glycosyltransferase family 2 protein [Ureibacillus sp. BA0131]MDN4492524.1 glycosyltransferase family 2 protein [Ureibacillus sp. BA0131]
MNKIIVGLPAYNEEAALPKLLDKLVVLNNSFEGKFHVVVVNDGSTDQTGVVLEKYASNYPFLSYINHPANKGLGEGMKTLFQYCLDNFDDTDVLITLDADNTHNPNIIPSLVSKLESEHLDLVIASRFTQGGKELGLSLSRKFYSRGAKLFFKLFYPIPNVSDYSCGYRAYQLGYVRKAFDRYQDKLITSNGFECMVEILARFSKIGVKAGEYPLVLEYQLKETASKMKIGKTILGYFKLLPKVKQPPLSDERGGNYE